MASLKDHLKKLVIAASYAFLSAVSVNLFWVPGGIYANGVTGFAQLVVALSGKFHLPMLDLATLVLLINVPLLVIAWFKIDRKFTIFTIIAVFLTSVFMKLIPVMALTNDPVICTVFGGVIHGLGVGITLNSDFSTGGLDIIGILVRKVTTRSIGTIFTALISRLNLSQALFLVGVMRSIQRLRYLSMVKSWILLTRKREKFSF